MFQNKIVVITGGAGWIDTNYTVYHGPDAIQ